MKSKTDIVEFSEALSISAAKYTALLNPTHTLWANYEDKARHAVETLRILGVVQTRPLLLAALETLSPKEMSKLLVSAVSWSVRLLIAGTHGTGPLETLFGTTAQKIWEGTYKTAKSIAQQMEKEVPNDARFEEDFAEANVSTARLARYYLRALERTVRNDSEPYFVPNDELVITLEHVMPEDRTNWHHIPEEIHQSYLTRLGNLVLLKAKPNSEIGNVSFATKKPYLKAADPKLTKEVGSYSAWGKDQIEEQQRRLAKLAVKTWPI